MKLEALRPKLPCGSTFRQRALRAGQVMLYPFNRQGRLQLGLDGFEQSEAHRAVVASQRDHEAHSTMLGGVGITRQGADARKGAGLEEDAIATAEQGGMRFKEVQQLGEAAGRETVAAANARAFVEIDGRGKAVLGECLARDLERLLKADRSAQTMPADLQEDLVGDVVVPADEQPGRIFERVRDWR